MWPPAALAAAFLLLAHGLSAEQPVAEYLLGLGIDATATPVGSYAATPEALAQLFAADGVAALRPLALSMKDRKRLEKALRQLLEAERRPPASALLGTSPEDRQRAVELYEQARAAYFAQDLGGGMWYLLPPHNPWLFQ